MRLWQHQQNHTTMIWNALHYRSIITKIYHLGMLHSWDIEHTTRNMETWERGTCNSSLTSFLAIASTILHRLWHLSSTSSNASIDSFSTLHSFVIDSETFFREVENSRLIIVSTSFSDRNLCDSSSHPPNKNNNPNIFYFIIQGVSITTESRKKL